MRITTRSVGGFTGRAGAETHTVDVDALPAAEAARLRALVEASKFFSLPPKILNKAPQPWDFVHHVEVEDHGRTHHVDFHEDAAPDALKELLRSVGRWTSTTS